jgi:hypothetical protein
MGGGARARRATWLVLSLGAWGAVAACTAPNPNYAPSGADARADHPGAVLPASPQTAEDGAPLGLDASPPGAAPDASADRAALASSAKDGSLAPSATATTCPARADLALCVPFEGSVVDESPNHLALETRGVSFASGGPGGEAADLGATSLIKLPDNPLFDLQAVTVEAWVNPRTITARMGVVDYNGQYGLILLAGGAPMCVGSNGGPAVLGAPIVAGVWTSLACAIDATSTSLWVNGTKVGSGVRTAPLRTASIAGITLGSDGPDGNPFDGLLDNVRIWKTVRAAADICAGAHRCP